jgi:hypothetical protein
MWTCGELDENLDSVRLTTTTTSPRCYPKRYILTPPPPSTKFAPLIVGGVSALSSRQGSPSLSLSPRILTSAYRQVQPPFAPSTEPFTDSRVSKIQEAEGLKSTFATPLKGSFTFHSSAKPLQQPRRKIKTHSRIRGNEAWWRVSKLRFDCDGPGQQRRRINHDCSMPSSFKLREALPARTL